MLQYPSAYSQLATPFDGLAKALVAPVKTLSGPGSISAPEEVIQNAPANLRNNLLFRIIARLPFNMRNQKLPVAAACMFRWIYGYLPSWANGLAPLNAQCKGCGGDSTPRILIPAEKLRNTYGFEMLLEKIRTNARADFDNELKSPQAYFWKRLNTTLFSTERWKKLEAGKRIPIVFDRCEICRNFEKESDILTSLDDLSLLGTAVISAFPALNKEFVPEALLRLRNLNLPLLANAGGIGAMPEVDFMASLGSVVAQINGNGSVTKNVQNGATTATVALSKFHWSVIDHFEFDAGEQVLGAASEYFFTPNVILGFAPGAENPIQRLSNLTFQAFRTMVQKEGYSHICRCDDFLAVVGPVDLVLSGAFNREVPL